MWITVQKIVTKMDNKRIKNADGTSMPLHVTGARYTSFDDLLEGQLYVDHDLLSV